MRPPFTPAGITAAQSGVSSSLVVYEKALNIYTDGSSLPKPRRGGIGVRYVVINDAGNEVASDETFTGYEGATNNEMELLACVKGLDGARDHPAYNSVERIYVFSDSMYVTRNVSLALFEWPKRRWLNRDGRPVENAELWKDLIRLIKKSPRRIEFEWVKGHSKNEHNKQADRLAKQSAKGVLNRPLKVVAVRRKQAPAVVQRGCVPMRGQVLSIRIITDTYMRVQKLYKYKYEVLAGTGEHASKVDLLFHETEDPLRAGHHYEVVVNTEPKNPRIVEVLREIERATASTQ